ncbi:MAG: hypothetical protein ACYC6O_08925, partial [Thermoleophilia bacterium]
GAPLSGCTVGATGVSCAASGLADGAHTIGVSVADMAGNSGTGSGSFTVDATAPAVTGITPTGTVNSAAQTVYANYSDTGSGIDTASVAVTLDGAPLSGCTVGATGVSCAASGLADGAHTIGVSVADMAGNSGTGSGSFTVSVPASVDVTYYAKASSGVSIASGISTNHGSCNDPSGAYVEELSTSIADECTSAYRWTITSPGDYSYNYYNTAFGSDTSVNGVSYQVTIRDGGTFGFQLFYIAANGTKTYLGTEKTQANSDGTTNNYVLDLSSQAGTVPAGAKIGLRTRMITANPDARIYIGNPDGRTSNISGKLIVNQGGGGGGDTTAPAVTNILPSGTITTSTTTVSASYSDAGSGINSATAKVYLDGTVMTGCTTTASSISCPASGLANGNHTIDASVADNSGNTGTGSGSFTVSLADATPPAVTNIQPTGTITTASTTVYASYSDAGTGINTATVSVTLDGTAMTGCTVGANTVSCPATGLANGVHNISVSVQDNAGNTGTGNGSFTVSMLSCTTYYIDSNGASISVYSDSGYTTKVCQQTQLNTNTDYYVQITHPNMNLSSEGTQTNLLTMYNMRNTVTNFGNGVGSVTFTQQAGGAPYRYRATFRTPTSAGVYALQTDIRSSAGGTKRVYTRGWNMTVGSTANYVRTYSNSSYTTQSDTFAPGSTVYMEMYDSSFTDGTPTTGQSGITWGTNWSGSTSNGTVASIAHPGNRTYRMSFTVPSGAGDKYIYARVRNSGGTTLAGYVRVLIHVQ